MLIFTVAFKNFKLEKKERWVSGLNQQFAKLPYALLRTEGSNPSLSTP